MISRIAIALACLASLLAIPANAAADEIEWMYDPDAVVEIHLGGLSEAELDELEAEPTLDAQVTVRVERGAEARSEGLGAG